MPPHPKAFPGSLVHPIIPRQHPHGRKIFTHTPRRFQKPGHGDKTTSPEEEKIGETGAGLEGKARLSREAGHKEEKESKQNW